MQMPYARARCQGLLSGLPPLASDRHNLGSVSITADRALLREGLAIAGIQAEQAGRGVVVYDAVGPYATVNTPSSPRKYVVLAHELPQRKCFTTLEEWSYRSDGALHIVCGAMLPYRRPDPVVPLSVLRQLQDIPDDDPRVIADDAARRERAALTIDDVRMVTCDSSVVALGITPNGFAPGDGLFVSIAIAGELARYTYETLDGHVGTRWEHLSWIDPIPMDDFVLHGITYLGDVTDIRPSDPAGMPLNAVDLLCAATAVAHDVPLYTARPKAYAKLKKVIKIIEYKPGT